VSNNSINGTIPSSFEQIRLNQIDLSNTKICAESFPKNWYSQQWNYCNLQIIHSCGIIAPKNCILNAVCNANMKCFVDQCATGIDQCQNGRSCIQNYQNWTYTCGNCAEFFWAKDGEFKCDLTTNALIVIICCSVGFILIVSIITLLICSSKKSKGGISETDTLIQKD